MHHPRKQWKLSLLALLTVMLLAGVVRAAPPPPFILNSAPDQARITIYSEYFEDDEAALSIADITSGEYDDRFEPASQFVERLGITDNPWWVRLSLQNELPVDERFALAIKAKADATLYLPKADGYRPADLEYQLPWRYPVYLLKLPQGAPQVFYLRLQPAGALSYSVTLSDINQQVVSQFQEDALYILLTGILLALAAYNLIAGLLRGGGIYLYHCGFVISVTTAALSLADFFGPIPTGMRGLEPAVQHFSIMVAIYFACAVARTFLQTQHNSPYYDYALLGTSILAVVSVPLALILDPAPLAYYDYGFAMLTALLLTGLGYSAWHRQLEGGALYFLVVVLVGVPVVIATLTLFGLGAAGQHLPMWIMLATIIQGIAHAIGLRLRHQAETHMEMEKQRSEAIANTIATTRKETLSRIGHDLRTPMSGIMGMADILEDTPLTPNQKECVTTIRHAGETLLKTISDELEYSEVSGDSTEFTQDSLNLNDLLMDAVDLFRERAEEKQVELITHVHTNVPSRVAVDGSRLRQILTNLIGALVRHGQRGELIIDVSMEPTGRADLVRFEFSGSTLTGETLQRLQETRSRNSSSRLNLAIAEQLIDGMEGRYGSREQGDGGQFWFVVSLPAIEESNPLPDVDTSLLAGRSMLVVDDSPTVTRVIRHLALSWGMRVTACHDPKEALATLRTQANINEPYDVVVLDHQMPGIDGMQLAARIHEDPVIIHPTLLIMLTGVHNAPTAHQARNVGIHRVLSKPVSAPRLRQILAEDLLQSHRLTGPDQSSAPDPELQLLVVEDHKLSQKVIRGMLNKLNLKADMAANGVEAVERVQNKRYDVILMDCEMPEMDGFEATRRIREYEKQQGLPQIPIIALTAHILREHQERSLAAGMNAHIPKPVELHTLRDTLIRFTQNDQIARPGQGQSFL